MSTLGSWADIPSSDDEAAADVKPRLPKPTLSSSAEQGNAGATRRRGGLKSRSGTYIPASSGGAGQSGGASQSRERSRTSKESARSTRTSREKSRRSKESVGSARTSSSSRKSSKNKDQRSAPAESKTAQRQSTSSQGVGPTKPVAKDAPRKRGGLRTRGGDRVGRSVRGSGEPTGHSKPTATTAKPARATKTTTSTATDAKPATSKSTVSTGAGQPDSGSKTHPPSGSSTSTTTTTTTSAAATVSSFFQGSTPTASETPSKPRTRGGGLRSRSGVYVQKGSSAVDASPSTRDQPSVRQAASVPATKVVATLTTTAPTPTPAPQRMRTPPGGVRSAGVSGEDTHAQVTSRAQPEKRRGGLRKRSGGYQDAHALNEIDVPGEGPAVGSSSSAPAVSRQDTSRVVERPEPSPVRVPATGDPPASTVSQHTTTSTDDTQNDDASSSQGTASVTATLVSPPRTRPSQGPPRRKRGGLRKRSGGFQSASVSVEHVDDPVLNPAHEEFIGDPQKRVVPDTAVASSGVQDTRHDNASQHTTDEHRSRHSMDTSHTSVTQPVEDSPRAGPTRSSPSTEPKTKDVVEISQQQTDSHAPAAVNVARASSSSATPARRKRGGLKPRSGGYVQASSPTNPLDQPDFGSPVSPGTQRVREAVGAASFYPTGNVTPTTVVATPTQGMHKTPRVYDRDDVHTGTIPRTLQKPARGKSGVSAVVTPVQTRTPSTVTPSTVTSTQRPIPPSTATTSSQPSFPQIFVFSPVRESKGPSATPSQDFPATPTGRMWSPSWLDDKGLRQPAAFFSPPRPAAPESKVSSPSSAISPEAYVEAAHDMYTFVVEGAAFSVHQAVFESVSMLTFDAPEARDRLGQVERFIQLEDFPAGREGFSQVFPLFYAISAALSAHLSTVSSQAGGQEVLVDQSVISQAAAGVLPRLDDRNVAFWAAVGAYLRMPLVVELVEDWAWEELGGSGDSQGSGSRQQEEYRTAVRCATILSRLWRSCYTAEPAQGSESLSLSRQVAALASPSATEYASSWFDLMRFDRSLVDICMHGIVRYWRRALARSVNTLDAPSDSAGTPASSHAVPSGAEVDVTPVTVPGGPDGGSDVAPHPPGGFSFDDPSSGPVGAADGALGSSGPTAEDGKQLSTTEGDLFDGLQLLRAVIAGLGHNQDVEHLYQVWAPQFWQQHDPTRPADDGSEGTVLATVPLADQRLACLEAVVSWVVWLEHGIRRFQQTAAETDPVARASRVMTLLSAMSAPLPFPVQNSALLLEQEQSDGTQGAAGNAGMALLLQAAINTCNCLLLRAVFCVAAPSPVAVETDEKEAGASVMVQQRYADVNAASNRYASGLHLLSAVFHRTRLHRFADLHGLAERYAQAHSLNAASVLGAFTARLDTASGDKMPPQTASTSSAGEALDAAWGSQVPAGSRGALSRWWTFASAACPVDDMWPARCSENGLDSVWTLTDLHELLCSGLATVAAPATLADSGAGQAEGDGSGEAKRSTGDTSGADGTETNGGEGHGSLPYPRGQSALQIVQAICKMLAGGDAVHWTPMLMEMCVFVATCVPSPVAGTLLFSTIRFDPVWNVQFFGRGGCSMAVSADDDSGALSSSPFPEHALFDLTWAVALVYGGTDQTRLHVSLATFGDMLSMLFPDRVAVCDARTALLRACVCLRTVTADCSAAQEHLPKALPLRPNPEAYPDTREYSDAMYAYERACAQYCSHRFVHDQEVAELMRRVFGADGDRSRHLQLQHVPFGQRVLYAKQRLLQEGDRDDAKTTTAGQSPLEGSAGEVEGMVNGQGAARIASPLAVLATCIRSLMYGEGTLGGSVSASDGVTPRSQALLRCVFPKAGLPPAVVQHLTQHIGSTLLHVLLPLLTQSTIHSEVSLAAREVARCELRDRRRLERLREQDQELQQLRGARTALVSAQETIASQRVQLDEMRAVRDDLETARSRIRELEAEVSAVRTENQMQAARYTAQEVKLTRVTAGLQHAEQRVSELSGVREDAVKLANAVSHYATLVERLKSMAFPVVHAVERVQVGSRVALHIGFDVDLQLGGGGAQYGVGTVVQMYHPLAQTPLTQLMDGFQSLQEVPSPPKQLVSAPDCTALALVSFEERVGTLNEQKNQEVLRWFPVYQVVSIVVPVAGQTQEQREASSSRVARLLDMDQQVEGLDLSDLSLE